jgi:hypothetical protein
MSDQHNVKYQVQFYLMDTTFVDCTFLYDGSTWVLDGTVPNFYAVIINDARIRIDMTGGPSAYANLDKEVSVGVPFVAFIW